MIEGKSAEKSPKTPEELKRGLNDVVYLITGENFKDGSAEVIMTKHLEKPYIIKYISDVLSKMRECLDSEELATDNPSFYHSVQQEIAKLRDLMDKIGKRNTLG